MPDKPKNNDVVRKCTYKDFLSDLRDVIGPALKETIRRGVETIDSRDQDEVLEVLVQIYCFTTMLLAEEAHARGVVDPLSDFEAEAGMLRGGYPELGSPVVPRAEGL